MAQAPPEKTVSEESVAQARKQAQMYLTAIARSVVMSFEREPMPGKPPHMCKSAASSVPASKDSIAGKLYEPGQDDFMAGDEDTGFRCLRFSVVESTPLMFDYKAAGDGASEGSSFRAIAHADLDGDGKLSTFSIEGSIVKEGAGLTVKFDPQVKEEDPRE